MTQMKLIYTTPEKIDELSIVNGQIIYAPVGNIICLDLKDKRFFYHTIYSFSTDIERQQTIGVDKGFYFVESTNIMWQYINDGWKQITSSNLSPLFYGVTVNDFPNQGTENTLFYTDDGVYNWKDSSQQYNLVANVNKWGSL